MSSGKKSKKTDGYTNQNNVRLIRGGKEYFDQIVGMIDNARDSIHLQTYIFDDDTTGHRVAEALKGAARRNVQVFVMTDGYASRLLSQRFINDLRKSGVQFRLFEPLLKSRYFYFGRRLHHKVLVTDARFALAGGINIADRYNDLPGNPAWLDFALYTEGEVARELYILCCKTWNGFQKVKGIVPDETMEAQLQIDKGNACDISMRRNDWVRRKNEISSTYVDIFRKANSHVTILCSYFLPGKMIRRQIADATRRGVKIRVITAGVSDIVIAKYAERHMYKWLLQQGVELHEYLPNVLHGKIAICDGQWLTLGSYNINNLSAYASIELNLNVRNEKFAKDCEEMLLEIAKRDCIQITTACKEHSGNIFKRLVQWFSYIFIHAGLFLSTFYYRHKA